MSDFDKNSNLEFDSLPTEDKQNEKQGDDVEKSTEDEQNEKQGDNVENSAEQINENFKIDHINENVAGTDVKQTSVQEIMMESEVRRLKRKSISNARKPLAFALLGLIFSLFYGFGIIFSCIAFPMSLKRFKKIKNQNNSWALITSVIGIVLNLTMIIIFGG